MWVKQCNLYHPPVITIFYRWYAYHSQSSVVCGIVLPTYIRLYKCYFMIRVPSFNYYTIIIPSLSIIPSFNHSYTILIPFLYHDSTVVIPSFDHSYTIILGFSLGWIVSLRAYQRPRLAAALGSPKPRLRRRSGGHMVDELRGAYCRCG